MKRKEIKELLLKSAKEEEIKDFSKEILQRVDYSKCEKVESDEVIYNNDNKTTHKKWFKPVFASCIALATCLCFAFVFMLGNIGVNNKQKELAQKMSKTFTREVLALGNAVSELGDYSEFSSMNFLACNEECEIEESYEEYRAIAKDINGYLFTAQAFLSGSNMNSKVVYNDNKEYSDYKYKIDVSFEDERDYSRNYTAYCNITEDNKKYNVEGIVRIYDKIYNIAGKTKIGRGDIKTKLAITTGENTYITVSNETEVNENEYEYIYYRDGKPERVVSMEMKNSDGEKKAEIEIIENNSVMSYEFVFQKQTIECEYTDCGKEKEIMIYVHNDYYFYVFENDYTVKMDKFVTKNNNTRSNF